METKTRIQKSNAEVAMHYERFSWLRFPGGVSIQTKTAPRMNGEEPHLVLESTGKWSVYDPTSVSELVLDFARITTPDDALAFANQYGLLGLELEPSIMFDRELRRPDLAEPLRIWLAEANHAAHTLELWGMVQAADASELRKIIRWESALVKIGNVPIAGHLPSTEKWLKIWKRGDVIGPAKLYLATQVNLHLHGKTSNFVSLDAFGKLKPHSAPINLLSALWIQILETVTGVQRIKRCSVCGEWMNVTDSRAHKDMHKSCSSRVRTRRYRRKKNGQ